MSRLNIELDSQDKEFLKMESNLGGGLNFTHKLGQCHQEFSIMDREHLQKVLSAIQKHLDETES